MSYRCQVCSEAQPARSKRNTLPAGWRPKDYPEVWESTDRDGRVTRYERWPDEAEALQVNGRSFPPRELFKPMKVSGFGRGYEIVSEIYVCDSCFEEIHPNEESV